MSVVIYMKDSFGARLKFFRSNNGLSQQKLADKCGLSRKIISDYEVKLNVLPRDVNLHKIANALDIDPSNLIPKTQFEDGELQPDGTTKYIINLNSFPKETIEMLKDAAEEADKDLDEIFSDLINEALIAYVKNPKKQAYPMDDDPIQENEDTFFKYLESKK